jgi:hypothetical protein
MAVTRLTTNGLTGTKYDIASADNYFMEPIATTLVGSGGVSSVTFSNIPNTYKHLQIRVLDAGGTGSDYGYSQIRVNGDSGSNYSRHLLYGDGATAQAFGAASQTGALISSASLSSGKFSAGVIDFLDYGNTNKYKTIRALSGVDLNGSGSVVFGSSVWMNSSPITSITLISYSTFQQHSRFSLYGIKG